ncbi:MAG TPA: hypothetical protein VMZ22_04175 [Acidimicrobiales bacterium]|nr:hypothetical protein [Acidimicrobiales bacterium]
MARRLSPRQKRARVLVVATVLSLVAIAMNAIAGGNRDEKLRQLGYLDDVRPLVAESTAQGADLASIRETAADLGRPGFRRRLNHVVQGTRDTLQAVKGLEPPRGADEAHSLLVATLQLRVLGAAAASKAMIDALSAEAAPPVVERLVAAGKNLLAADQTYKAFTDVIGTALTEGTAAAVTPSAWVEDDTQWEPPELTAFVNILKANSSVNPVVDVSTILVKTTPTPVGKEGEKLLLPKTGLVRLEVVVANVGNVAQKRVTVTASLQQGSGLPDVAQNFVDLSPGKRHALTVRGLKTGPGDAVLTVTIGPLAGETSVVDNTKNLQLSIHS